MEKYYNAQNLERAIGIIELFSNELDFPRNFDFRIIKTLQERI